MTKSQLRRYILSKRVSIAEIVRQTGVSRNAVRAFKNTGKINPATFATIAVNLVLPDAKPTKGEE